MDDDDDDSRRHRELNRNSPNLRLHFDFTVIIDAYVLRG